MSPRLRYQSLGGAHGAALNGTYPGGTIQSPGVEVKPPSHADAGTEGAGPQKQGRRQEPGVGGLWEDREEDEEDSRHNDEDGGHGKEGGGRVKENRGRGKEGGGQGKEGGEEARKMEDEKRWTKEKGRRLWNLTRKTKTEREIK
ncbi:hypothetical protein NDU88_005312 [Pleurodeles waltl]|uniref:Uncharacterized protein n=1 Tax=Pleurodeles waltl TaxID=8319 RepID=A0AAV7LNR4_PLEWA|nr:hypothetical protein NDU88_005312 [Pleurodeles waltl]